MGEGSARTKRCDVEKGKNKPSDGRTKGAQNTSLQVPYYRGNKSGYSHLPTGGKCDEQWEAMCVKGRKEAIYGGQPNSYLQEYEPEKQTEAENHSGSDGEGCWVPTTNVKEWLGGRQRVHNVEMSKIS